MSNERPPAEKVISAKGAKNKLRENKSGQRKIKAQAQLFKLAKIQRLGPVFFSFW